MNYKDYKMMKAGNYCSVGMFGDNIYAFEHLTGSANIPEYMQITKDEFDKFTGSTIYGERKLLCSAHRGFGIIDVSSVLSDEEIEQKKKDKSLWRAGIYSEEYYNGQGVAVLNYTPYKLTKRAYDDIPVNDSLPNGSKNYKMGYLWQFSYQEIVCNKHPKGTYCETIKCGSCEFEFYYNNTTIPYGEKYQVICPNCKSSLILNKYFS